MTEDLGFVHRYVPGEGPVTLLLLHGTGGNEDDLLPLGRALLPDAPLLSPRGKVLEQGMPRFFRRLAMGVFDVEDLQRRTHELAGFVERASESHGFDLGSLVAVGYSNGANIAASMLFLRPDVLRNAILLHAMVPFQLDESPDLSSARVLLTGGQRDPMIPLAQTRELEQMLSASGADVELAVQPGGHELTNPEVDAARAWLERNAAALR